MNSLHAIGRVGGDAELHYIPSGAAVASFSMALDNGKDKNGNKKQPTWIKAVLWEKRAESLAEYITKGKLVSVVGPVTTEAWVDKQTGEAKSKAVITVREFEFCGGPKSEESGGDETDQRTPENYAQAPSAVQPGAPITDEDIPF